MAIALITNLDCPSVSVTSVQAFLFSTHVSLQLSRTNLVQSNFHLIWIGTMFTCNEDCYEPVDGRPFRYQKSIWQSRDDSVTFPVQGLV